MPLLLLSFTKFCVPNINNTPYNLPHQNHSLLSLSIYFRATKPHTPSLIMASSSNSEIGFSPISSRNRLLEIWRVKVPKITGGDFCSEYTTDEQIVKICVGIFGWEAERIEIVQNLRRLKTRMTDPDVKQSEEWNQNEWVDRYLGEWKPATRLRLKLTKYRK